MVGEAVKHRVALRAPGILESFGHAQSLAKFRGEQSRFDPKAARKARAPGSASDKRTARPATVEEASCRSQEAMSGFSVNAFCLKLNAVSRVRGLAVPST